jgi:hypothetical protein
MAIISAYHTYIPPPRVARGIQWSLEARRATILFRRGAAGVIIGAGAPNTSPHSEMDPYREELEQLRQSPMYGEDSPNVTKHSQFSVNTGPDRYQLKRADDYVAIIDVDAKGKDLGYEVIKLPAIPRELNWNTESAFASIKPIGRNNAFYHYTGSEDKLEFEIDWYSTQWDRTEVIRQCRKIESLAKADGYVGDPHRVMLKWGDQNVLFQGMYFQIIEASYRLTQFNKAQIREGGIVESTYMLPVQAYQKVVMARITETNLTKLEIETVSGINFR